MVFKLLHLAAMVSKYLFYGTLLQLFICGILLAHDGDAQHTDLNATTLSLHLKDASIPEVFSAIEAATNFRFSYEMNDIDSNMRTDFSATDITLAQILQDLSEKTGLTFKRINQSIHVSASNTAPGGIKRNPTRQQIKVTGKVTSGEDGEGLPGANIVIKGSTNGTVTNIEGHFSIEVEGPETVLVISSVGYEKQEIRVGNRSVINITLTSDITALSEVVVVGYGTMKKSDVTGALSQISAEELKAMPVQNTIQAIQGRAAGVDITSNARPGESGVIRIRGTRSISAGSDPLIVVDGVPLQAGGLESFNPNDIESIEVLKDASASAIYGSRAANGVILVTTKKGQSGKAIIRYDGALTVETLNDLSEMFNAPEYAEYRRDATRAVTGDTGYGTPYPNPDDDYFYFGDDASAWESIAAGYSWIDKDNLIPEMRATTAEEQALWGVSEVPVYDPNKVPTTNWTEHVKQTGITQNHNLSVSMGTDKTSTYISGGYLNQTGTNVGQDYNRYSALLKLEAQAVDWLKLGGTLNATYSIQNYGFSGSGSRGARTIYEAARSMLPFTVPYDAEGNYIYNPGGNPNIVNPIRDGDLVINERTTLRVFGSFFAEAKLAKGLRYKLIFGPDIRNYRNGEFQSEESSLRGGGSSSSTNYARLRQSQRKSWTMENLLFYDKTINDLHSISLTLLQSSSSWLEEYSDMNATNLPYNSQLWYNLGSTNEGALNGWGSSYSKRTLMSYMARVNYSLMNKYLLTLSGRWDGASVLAEGNKWDFFPSFVVAWKLNEENFMDGFSALSELKLRVGLGTVGNQAVSPYNTAGVLVRLPYVFGSTPASGYVTGNPKGSSSQQGSIPNKDLGWEKTRQWNFGVDFGFLADRITGSVNYYVSNTYDLLLDKTPNSVTGYSNITINAGKTRNTGVEVTINSVNISTSDFSWSTDLTFSRNRTEIVELASGKEDDVNNKWFIGEPIGVYYDYKKIGIWQTADADEMQKYNDNGATYEAGDIRVEDVNGDYVIDQNNDRQIIGYTAPKWTGGMVNTFSYKRLELSAFMYSRWGYTIEGGAVDMSGQYASRKVDYWREDNPTNAYPKADWNNGGQPIHYSAMNYQDGSFIKVRYISLAYMLPQALLQRFQVGSMKLYAQVHNPFLYAKQDFLDPDSNYQNSGSNNSASSITTRSYVFGINLTF